MVYLYRHKFGLIGCLLFAMLVVSTSSTNIVLADKVEVPDENLQKVLREILKRKQIEKEEFTSEDLSTIYFLHADERGIKDSTGLEHCVNLAEVSLAKNEIEDVTPLTSSPNIQLLDLSYNRVTDISALSKLQKLQYLQLEHNKVEEISAVSELKAMNSLYLTDNRISDISPVAELSKIWSLYLADNQVSDISSLKQLKWLSNLDLQRNAVKDVTPLTELTELRWTFLQKNQIEDISPLVNMAKKDIEGEKRFAPFWNLRLEENPLKDESKETLIPELEKMGVRLKSQKTE